MKYSIYIRRTEKSDCEHVADCNDEKVLEIIAKGLLNDFVTLTEKDGVRNMEKLYCVYVTDNELNQTIWKELKYKTCGNCGNAYVDADNDICCNMQCVGFCEGKYWIPKTVGAQDE